MDVERSHSDRANISRVCRSYVLHFSLSTRFQYSDVLSLLENSGVKELPSDDELR